ncbi:MAG TPA: GAF domain-containing protein, partial [Herpetosiphonaceae bacterium]
MDIDTTPQLHRWLEQHAERLIARWAELLGAVWPEAAPALQIQGLEQLFAAAQQSLNGQSGALEQRLQSLPIDWDALELPTILQVPFQLRRAVLELMAEQQFGAAESLGLIQELEPLLESSVATISRRYSEQVHAELREQVEQAELLASHQAQMADEADRVAMQLSTLYDISQTLSASLEREQLLNSLGPSLLKALGVEHCALWLSDAAEMWTPVRAWGPKWQKLSGSTFQYGSLPAAMRRACETDKPQVIEKAAARDGGWLISGQGALFVAMRSENHAIACLVAQAPRLHERLEPATLNLYRTIANQILVALQNAHLYNEVQALNADLEQKVAVRTAELREERDRLEAVSDIARDISTLEIDVLLNRTLQALANLTGVKHGSVMLVESGTDLLVDRAVLSETEHIPGFTRFQMGEGIVGWIAQHRQPAVVNDVRTDERWVELDAYGERRGKNTGSLVGMPLIAGDDVVGVLMLSHPDPNYFNQSHIRLLKAIAGEIAIAIYNAQLYEFLGDRTNRLYTMLRHQEEATSQNNAILQSLNDAVIVVSLDRSIILANAAAERLMEMPLDEIIARDIDDLMKTMQLKLPPNLLNEILEMRSGLDPAEGLAGYSAAQSDAADFSSSTIIVQRAKQSLSISIGPVLTERGELLGACLIIRDITLEVESDRLKTEFIGTVSHELRTPMTSIKGYTQLLAMGSLGEVNDTQKEFLNTITSNAERMINIINDLLDITKIETGSVELQPNSLRVAEVLSEAISVCRVDLTQRGHELGLALSPNLPPIFADPERLHQVVKNILANAIKYTPSGGRISIGAVEVKRSDIPARWQEGLSAGRRFVQISVQDTGVGIDPSEHDKVFERFYRTENPLK